MDCMHNCQIDRSLVHSSIFCHSQVHQPCSISSVAFDDGESQLVATGSKDAICRVFRLDALAELPEINSVHSALFENFLFSVDDIGKTIFVKGGRVKKKGVFWPVQVYFAKNCPSV